MAQPAAGLRLPVPPPAARILGAGQRRDAAAHPPPKPGRSAQGGGRDAGPRRPEGPRAAPPGRTLRWRTPADARAAAGLQAGPLPERPAVPRADRTPADRDPGHRVQPPRLLSTRGVAQHSVPPLPAAGRHRRTEGRAGRQDPRSRRRQQDRPRRARALHADPVARAVPRPVGQGDQHPPQLPAQLQGRQALPPGLRAWREAHRRDGPLRDQRPRRGPDHRAGGRPHRPQHAARTTRRHRPRHGMRRAGAGHPVACRTPRAAERQPDGGVPLKGQGKPSDELRAARRAGQEQQAAGRQRPGRRAGRRLAVAVRLRPACERHPPGAAPRHGRHPLPHRRRAAHGLPAAAHSDGGDDVAHQAAGAHGRRREAPATGRSHQDAQPGRRRSRNAAVDAAHGFRRKDGHAHLRPRYGRQGSGVAGLWQSRLGPLGRARQAAARHHPRDRPDGLGQDDDAVLDAEAPGNRRGQRDDHRRPDRNDRAGLQPDAGAERTRLRLRRRPAGADAAGPGHHHGRRNPRPRDGRDGYPGRADGSPGLQHAAHQRLGVGHHPAAGPGRAELPAQRHHHRRAGPAPHQLHPDADAGHPAQRRHGADDRRDDDQGHPARPAGDDQQPAAVLGPDRVDVDRQPDADRAEPAADRHLDQVADGALPLPVPGHRHLLLHRHLLGELQRAGCLPDGGLRAAGLRLLQTELRTRATAAGLHPRPADGGIPAPGAAPRTRGLEHVPDAPALRRAADRCGADDSCGHAAVHQEQAGRGVPRGG
ncbi:unnamed protein product, partial [Rotaria sp. Silwood1]